MIEVTDIKGIGPAKAETLADAGYESVEDIANADADELGEVEGVGEDRALEFIVGAADLLESTEEVEEETDDDEFDLKPSDVGDELEDEVDELEEELKEELEDTESPTDDEDQTYTVSIDFSSDDEYHTFHAAIMRYYERIYTSNQPASDAMAKILEKLTDSGDVEYELDEQELNTLHTAVKQMRTQYQGDNLIDQMDALRSVEEQINEQRREALF